MTEADDEVRFPIQDQEGPADHERWSLEDGFFVTHPRTGRLVFEPAPPEAAPLSPADSARIDQEVRRRVAAVLGIPEEKVPGGTAPTPAAPAPVPAPQGQVTQPAPASGGPLAQEPPASAPVPMGAPPGWAWNGMEWVPEAPAGYRPPTVPDLPPAASEP